MTLKKCSLGSKASSTGAFPLNRIHSWTIQLHDAAGAPLRDASITVSGGMPEHDHGLPTAPRVTAHLGEGRYLLEGLRFHMQGAWRLSLHVSAAGVDDMIVFDFEV